MSTQRGRRSAAALAIAAPTVEIVQRPDAPYDLTDEQVDEWRAIVNRLPADWFPRETHGVLAQLCRHIVNARRVAQLITAELENEKLDVGVYEQLLRMQAKESALIVSLSTKLRITQQATVRAEKARKPTMVDTPWQA
jgi:hypothetical protein